MQTTWILFLTDFEKQEWKWESRNAFCVFHVPLKAGRGNTFRLECLWRTRGKQNNSKSQKPLTREFEA